MSRYVCIHGHFYQPPRENPWLEAIEIQDSADPYHDWNERITAECYEPNATSRILDEEDRIVRIVNNYARISFNFGPTLLVWLEDHAPEVYRAILDADRWSQERFGHGSALAQPYNHMIMPLANRRDQVTQTRWGIRDFEHRFGRRPEGMWLPETAVSLETLDVLAEEGIRFTVLAPHQAARVRRAGEDGWREADPEAPRRAYRVALPSGRSITAFFYHGPVSRAIAFQGLLRKGEDFAHALLHALPEDADGADLVHIATDGETYGHHHRHGDMALAYALHTLEDRDLASVTNYRAYLAAHPVEHEAAIHEDTSWSCAHGVERWRGDCGCTTGGPEGWHQRWRGPLRAALDWLRDELAPRYEKRAAALLKDPWRARDAYIDVILDRSPENLDRWFSVHATHELAPEERVTALQLLELQRHAMLMYTSCGWFFNDVSRIEAVQVLQYAARAIQLARDLFGEDLEPPFRERLAEAPSNVPAFGDGRRVYEALVQPARVDLPKVAAHYAMSSLFVEYEEEARVYSYRVEREAHETLESGETVLALGRVRVTSAITEESARLVFAVLRFGHHNLSCGVRPFQGADAFAALTGEMRAAFTRGDFSQTLRLLDDSFQGRTYTLGSLFRDEQRAILDQILDTTMDEAEAAYRWLYQHQSGLMRFLQDLGAPLPRAFTQAADFVLNVDLRRALAAEEPDLDRVRDLLERVEAWDVDLDATRLGFALEQTLERQALRFREDPSHERLERLEALVDLCGDLPFEVSLWKAQNAYYQVLQEVYPHRRERAEKGDDEARAWAERFQRVGQELAVRVP